MAICGPKHVTIVQISNLLFFYLRSSEDQLFYRPGISTLSETWRNDVKITAVALINESFQNT